MVSQQCSVMLKRYRSKSKCRCSYRCRCSGRRIGPCLCECSLDDQLVRQVVRSRSIKSANSIFDKYLKVDKVFKKRYAGKMCLTAKLYHEASNRLLVENGRQVLSIIVDSESKGSSLATMLYKVEVLDRQQYNSIAQLPE